MIGFVQSINARIDDVITPICMTRNQLSLLLFSCLSINSWRKGTITNKKTKIGVGISFVFFKYIFMNIKEKTIQILNSSSYRSCSRRRRDISSSMTLDKYAWHLHEPLRRGQLFRIQRENENAKLDDGRRGGQIKLISN